MKKIISLLMLMALFAACKNQPTDNGVYYVKVVSVVDGDTFHGLTSDGKDVKFRIYGIDAPEKKQAYGQQSTQHLSNLILNRRVKIKVQTKSDRYGRPVVWVYTPDGHDVTAEMLRAGMAWHYSKYDSTAEYAELERDARKSRTGLWRDRNPVAPWNFKSRQR
ncbi:MAG: thermonuclease family protein [Tannerella sp.]|jgi:endonuclease YncB( thermonuclease family)|nr:thermonuclease family protein [Tannerella sp.]